jgi:hypothetical protein
MKYLLRVALICALAIPAIAQDTNVNTNTVADTQAPGQLFLASAATLTAPLILTNDYFYLASDQAEVANGGKAVFDFTVTNAGNFVIEAVVNAPDESSNSFFVNIDTEPVDPDMIWDVAVTSGFEKRMVNWRGGGADSESDEFAPKRFKLESGEHKLIVVGREPGTLLKSLTIRLAPPEQPASP